jgi:hypothetical protein
MQSTSTPEYLNWKIPSGLVNVRSVVCADKGIDSPQKQIAISVFINQRLIMDAMHAKRQTHVEANEQFAV